MIDSMEFWAREMNMEEKSGRGTMRFLGILLCAAALGLASAANLGAQARNDTQASAATTARASAPKDFTGYWVSVVTEDWRYRMVVPDKGDYVSVPLNFAGRQTANGWDPAKDQASANQCKGYGAAAIMEVPGRLHIYWQDDNTLRIDTDSGTQTRLFHFGGSAPENMAPNWQGYSAARWGDDEPIVQRVGGGGPVGQGGPEYENQLPAGSEGNADREITYKPIQRSYLQVTTTHMRPGYLRKNGVPYSGNAILREYFNTFTYRDQGLLFITTVVNDPQYLIEPYITHSHFKKIADGSGWDPTPCRVDEPR
jgi:hypothetical protein